MRSCFICFIVASVFLVAPAYSSSADTDNKGEISSLVSYVANWLEDCLKYWGGLADDDAWKNAYNPVGDDSKEEIAAFMYTAGKATIIKDQVICFQNLRKKMQTLDKE